MTAPNDGALSSDSLVRLGPSDLETLMLYRLSRSTGWTAFFAFVIAVAMVVGGYVYWQQLVIMQDTLDEVQDLSEKLQARFEADAAQSAALTKAIQALTAELARDNRTTAASPVPAPAPTSKPAVAPAAEAAPKPAAEPPPPAAEPPKPAAEPPAAALPDNQAPAAAPQTEPPPAPAPDDKAQ